MGKGKKLFWLFILIDILFIVGVLFDFKILTITANYSLIPALILYYRVKSSNWFLPMVLALLSFYIRDIFLLYGFVNYLWVIIPSFFFGILVIYIFAISGFQNSSVHFVELTSLIIMYGFLGFLFYTIAELVSQVMPTIFETTTYLYLFLLILLLAITFTGYLLKSHYASLWLMLASASFLVSEISLFFKIYIISDVSVNIFFPLFHVIAYYALIEYALHRRRSARIPYF